MSPQLTYRPLKNSAWCDAEKFGLGWCWVDLPGLILKGRSFSYAITTYIFVITNRRTGVPDERRLRACWGEVQPVRDLLFVADGFLPHALGSRLGGRAAFTLAEILLDLFFSTWLLRNGRARQRQVFHIGGTPHSAQLATLR